MARIVTLGEIMLRLKSPALERFFQSPSIEATLAAARRTWPFLWPTTAWTRLS